MYREIGGDEAIRGAVAVFYRRVLDDPELADYFVDVDLGVLRAHQRAFLTEALGGPHLFTGRPLAEAHARLHITDDAFDKIVEHLVAALREVGVTEEYVAVVRETLAPLRSKIVNARRIRTHH